MTNSKREHIKKINYQEIIRIAAEGLHREDKEKVLEEILKELGAEDEIDKQHKGE